MTALMFLALSCSAMAAPADKTPPSQPSAATQTAVLAGGCFWGVEGVFERVRGVRNVVSGYAGGDKSTAHYEEVGTGLTGHAESVQITFDPAVVTYGELLRIFFSVAHDPTQLNRQGPDTGTQYRSAIFYANDAQRNLASSYIDELNKSGKFSREIVTRVDPLKAFYPAERYHQDFIARNPQNPYVVFNDLPKIRDLKRLYPEYYREDVPPR
jgi:peptide-methionine (S)-S-oxide reductase